MKINFSPLPRVSLISPKANNQAHNINSIQYDTFQKSSKDVLNLAFCGSKYDYPILKDMLTKCIMYSPSIDTESIGNIISTFCPETGFDDIKNAPKQDTNINYASAGYTSEPIAVTIDENGKFVVVAGKRTIYANFATHTKTEKEHRMKILDTVLHEVTHTLQESPENENCKVNFINSFLKNQSNQQEIAITLNLMNKLFSNTELRMLEALKGAYPSLSSLPKEINKRNDINTFFTKKYKISASCFARNLISNSLNTTKAKSLGLDVNSILDFTILKSQNEIEAYKNALESDKEQLNIPESSKTDFDLRIEVYEAMITAAKSLKTN